MSKIIPIVSLDMQNVTYIQKSLLAYNGIGLAEDSALRRELYLRWPDCRQVWGSIVLHSDIIQQYIEETLNFSQGHSYDCSVHAKFASWQYIIHML